MSSVSRQLQPPYIVSGARQPAVVAKCDENAVLSATHGILTSPNNHSKRRRATTLEAPESPTLVGHSEPLNLRSSAEELLEILRAAHLQVQGDSDDDVKSRHVNFQEPVVLHEPRHVRVYERTIPRKLSVQENSDTQKILTHIIAQLMMLIHRISIPPDGAEMPTVRGPRDDTVISLMGDSSIHALVAPMALSFGVAFELHSRLLLPATSNSPSMHTRMYDTALGSLRNIHMLRAKWGIIALPLWLVPEYVIAGVMRVLQRKRKAASDKWLGTYAIPFRSTLGPHAPYRRYWTPIHFYVTLPYPSTLGDSALIMLEHVFVYAQAALSIITALILALLP